MDHSLISHTSEGDNYSLVYGFVNLIVIILGWTSVWPFCYYSSKSLDRSLGSLWSIRNFVIVGRCSIVLSEFGSPFDNNYDFDNKNYTISGCCMTLLVYCNIIFKSHWVFILLHYVLANENVDWKMMYWQDLKKESYDGLDMWTYRADINEHAWKD